MTLQECYCRMQGDYADALNRLMRDQLIERFVLNFPKDQSMQQLRDATAAGIQNDAFRAAHTLKGVAKNLSLTKLADSASELAEQLRDGTQMPDPILLAEVEKDYKLVIDTLAVYVEEKE